MKVMVNKKAAGLFMLIAVIFALALPFTLKQVQAANETTTTTQTEATTSDASTASADDAKTAKAIAAAIVVGLAATGGALGMGIAISKSSEGIARQPEASGPIRSTLMLGLVFIETAIIYALIVAILVIFVL